MTAELTSEKVMAQRLFDEGYRVELSRWGDSSCDYLITSPKGEEIKVYDRWDPCNGIDAPYMRVASGGAALLPFDVNVYRTAEAIIAGLERLTKQSGS